MRLAVSSSHNRRYTLVKRHTEPLTQIVAGVAMLLAGVLNLLGNLLSGLGLDSWLKGIVAATVRFYTTGHRKRANVVLIQGLDKIYKGLGLDKWLSAGKK